jgi:hypothetical protein
VAFMIFKRYFTMKVDDNLNQGVLARIPNNWKIKNMIGEKKDE